MTHKSTDWVEESAMLGKGVKRPGMPLRSADHMGSSITDHKLPFVFGFIATFFLLLFGRIGYLQLVQGAYFLNESEANRQLKIPIIAERGIIYDIKGRALTKNIPGFSLALSPQELPRLCIGNESPPLDTVCIRGKRNPERERLVKRLAELTHNDEAELRETLDTYGGYSLHSIVIEEDLDYETALAIQIAATDLPGLYIQRGSKRLYEEELLLPIGPSLSATTTAVFSFSHVLGYVGKIDKKEYQENKSKGYLLADTTGKLGIEKSYETQMRGVYGYRLLEVDTYGKEQSTLEEKAPIPGAHLRLSIDAAMQAKLEELITARLISAGKTRASAVALDPQTGAIRALVSLPAFHNNDFSGGISSDKYTTYLENIDRPLFNRALSGTYPSGSTIKPAIAAAALEEGVITKDTTILSTGGISISPWFFPDWQAGGHGITNVRKSIAESVNTFYYTIGGGNGSINGLGVDRIGEYLHEFGFGAVLGIDLSGEAAGFIPSAGWKKEVKGEPWYIGDTYNLSIGQGGLLVTPLQIAAMTGVMANGGTLFKPYTVESIIDPMSNTETNIESKIIRQHMVAPIHIETVRLGMRDCVTSGSCRLLSTLPIAVAGKTGTAQWNQNKENHAWFTSFAPFDHPEIVLTVLVEEGEEGSRISAPIANDFYRWWAEYRSLRVDNKPIDL